MEYSRAYKWNIIEYPRIFNDVPFMGLPQEYPYSYSPRRVRMRCVFVHNARCRKKQHLHRCHTCCFLPRPKDDDDVYPRETPPHIRTARASPQWHTAAGTAASTTADTGNTVPQRANPTQTARFLIVSKHTKHGCGDILPLAICDATVEW